MPAVQLTRLKQQLEKLSKLFDQPSLYREGFNNLLDFYADRVHRHSPELKPLPLAPSFRVPSLVIRLIEQELLGLTILKPEAALAVADELWQENNLESRLFSAAILGWLPVSQKVGVFYRLVTWSEGKDDNASLNLLFNRGTEMIRRDDPMTWFTQIEKWSLEKNEKYQILAIKALQAFAEDTSFDNLPPVYRLLSPQVHQVNLKLQASLELILETLARRSPGETAYFLRQILASTKNQATIRLIRKIIPSFDQEYQVSLKMAVKDLSHQMD
jgi:hypothetical protein